METPKGHYHPFTIVIRDVLRAFTKLGFSIAESPEIESEHYNFDMLNVPPEHPARDMQDTFWIKGRDRTVLRTHVSNTQVRYMEQHKPPLRIVYFGRVFRNEATDATHEAQFSQFEALAVGKDLTLGSMKAVLDAFITEVFGPGVKTRLRPGYFPFVEPGVEVDISCFKCGENGKKECPVCKGTGWVEVLGAGMVHPKVLSNGGISPIEWQGFAFGVGWDRIAMLKYGIDDVRLFYSGDLRMINQF